MFFFFNFTLSFPFSRSSTKEMQPIKDFFRKYKVASDQRINFDKSDISFSWNVFSLSQNQIIQ